jgi:hypothetical protein
MPALTDAQIQLALDMEAVNEALAAGFVLPDRAEWEERQRQRSLGNVERRFVNVAQDCAAQAPAQAAQEDWARNPGQAGQQRTQQLAQAGYAPTYRDQVARWREEENAKAARQMPVPNPEPAPDK